MKLYQKMILIFSAIMLSAILVYSSYMTDKTVSGSRAFTEMRFSNMSTSISRDISQEFYEMNMTVRELKENLSFLSSLSQFVSSAGKNQASHQKAYNSAIQKLYQAPMTDLYYRVSFLSSDGDYITSLPDEDPEARISPSIIKEEINLLEEESLAVPDQTYMIIPPRRDVLNPSREVTVYGILSPVNYAGSVIGYLTVLNQTDSLDRIMDFVDDTVFLEIEAVLENGDVLYSSRETPRSYSSDISTGKLTAWEDPQEHTIMSVEHTWLPSLGLDLYVAEDSKINTWSERAMRRDALKTALLIFLAAVCLVTVVSLLLTRSIRRLTRRIAQTPSDAVLLEENTSSDIITQMVTSPADREIYHLEQEYNQLLQRVQSSMTAEIALRESALQARLKALQTQINPHFIYNTLNIISAKAMESENYDIIELCDQFADMLRYSTDTRSQSATLEQELSHVRHYLAICKFRYEDSLEYSIDVPESLYPVTVPKLTLQPLVENALTHGFDGTNDMRKLSITGSSAEGSLRLEIRDNGTGFAPDMLASLQQQIREIESGHTSAEKAGGHIGLLGTCLRLYYYSKGTMHMRIYNDQGAVIELTMKQPEETT